MAKDELGKQEPRKKKFQSPRMRSFVISRFPDYSAVTSIVIPSKARNLSSGEKITQNVFTSTRLMARSTLALLVIGSPLSEPDWHSAQLRMTAYLKCRRRTN